MPRHGSVQGQPPGYVRLRELERSSAMSGRGEQAMCATGRVSFGQAKSEEVSTREQAKEAHIVTCTASNLEVLEGPGRRMASVRIAWPGRQRGQWIELGEGEQGGYLGRP